MWTAYKDKPLIRILIGRSRGHPYRGVTLYCISHFEARPCFPSAMFVILSWCLDLVILAGEYILYPSIDSIWPSCGHRHHSASSLSSSSSSFHMLAQHTWRFPDWSPLYSEQVLERFQALKSHTFRPNGQMPCLAPSHAFQRWPMCKDKFVLFDLKDAKLCWLRHFVATVFH